MDIHGYPWVSKDMAVHIMRPRRTVGINGKPMDVNVNASTSSMRPRRDVHFIHGKPMDMNVNAHNLLDINGNPQIHVSMDIHAYPLLSMHFHGEIHCGCPWTSMDLQTHEKVGISLPLPGAERLPRPHASAENCRNV